MLLLLLLQKKRKSHCSVKLWETLSTNRPDAIFDDLIINSWPWCAGWRRWWPARATTPRAGRTAAARATFRRCTAACTVTRRTVTCTTGSGQRRRRRAAADPVRHVLRPAGGAQVRRKRHHLLPARFRVPRPGNQGKHTVEHRLLIGRPTVSVHQSLPTCSLFGEGNKKKLRLNSGRSVTTIEMNQVQVITMSYSSFELDFPLSLLRHAR